MIPHNLKLRLSLVFYFNYRITSTSNSKTMNTFKTSNKPERRKLAFTPTTIRPQHGFNITRNPYIIDEYNGNYNEKWGFTKKIKYRSRPPWWTRAPFYVTRNPFDPPVGFVYPPGPTKLFWPGLKNYRRLGPLLPKSTYPPVWFRTGATNRAYTLPPQRPLDLQTEIAVEPKFQNIDSFELDTDPVPTFRIRTGKTIFPYTVYPFIKKALWGKVKPEDRESFTYPPKWVFDEDNDGSFLLRSEEFTESYEPSEARAATAWMDSSLSETTLERPEDDEQKANLHKRKPTYPPVWIRTGKTNFPYTVHPFIKKDLWGKVKPEDRETFTNVPHWMLDCEDFLVAEDITDPVEPTIPTTPTWDISTLHTSPWWTYPAYWIKRHPHLNVTERITTPDSTTEDGPAEWTKPTDLETEPSVTESAEVTTTRRSFVFDILEQKKNRNSSIENKINQHINILRERKQSTIAEERPRYFNDYPRYSNDKPRYENKYPRFGREYPRFNNEYPRHSRDRPRYENRNPSFEYPRYGRGNSRFSRQNRRYSNSRSYYPKDNQAYTSDGNREGQSVTYRKRFKYRPKRSTSLLDYQLFQLHIFNKLNFSQEPILSNQHEILGNKIQAINFRPETLWRNLRKQNMLIKKDNTETSNKIKNIRDNLDLHLIHNDHLLLQYDVQKNIGSRKVVDKRYIHNNDDFFKKQKNKKSTNDFKTKFDALLDEQEDSSSGSGSQSLSTLLKSFESDEESDNESNTPKPKLARPTKFKWVERKWAGFNSDKSESDLSILKEPSTYFPKAQKQKLQLRRELRTKVPKVIRVPFRRTMLRRTTPQQNWQRKKRDIFNEMQYETTERDLHFEAWLKSKREEEEREKLLFDYEYGLTTPDYLNEPIRSPKAVRRRARQMKMTYVVKTRRPKIYVVPFTLPERLRKKEITLKGRLQYGRRKKTDTREATPNTHTTPTSTVPPGYFKFGKRIYWLTQRPTFRPTWLRPRRLKPLTTATTTEMPSPKFATLINIYRTTEKPTTPVKRRRTYKARTFRTLKKIIITTKAATSDSIDSDFVVDDDEEESDDDDDDDDDDPPRRTFPTLKIAKRKKQEVISFREYLQRRDNLKREQEEIMWNAQFTPESEEEITTMVPVISTLPIITSTTSLPTLAPIVSTITLPPIVPTVKRLHLFTSTETTSLTTPTIRNIFKPLKSLEDPVMTVLQQTTPVGKIIKKVKNTRGTYRTRKPRNTRSGRGRARRTTKPVDILPTIPFSDTGRTKRELLYPESESLDVTTEGNIKTLESVFEALNKQKMALQEAFYERYEMPKTETTTFEYNIDNLCQVYNADYEKTSRSWYLEHLCKTINITTTPKQGPIPFLNSYYSSSNDTDSIKNIFKRSIIDNGRIRFDTRMRSVSKKIRRIPIDLHFNNSEFTDQKHPNFDLYNARRKVWFNTTFGNHPRSNYAQNQFQRSNWRFYTNLTTYIPNFKRYFQNKKMWFNRTNDMHYRRNYEIPGNYPEKQHNKWFLRETLKELKQNHKKVTFSSRFQRQKARLKESNLIPNFDERDVIKQRFRWGDKPYIPRIDKYTAQKVLFQHENPDQSIEDRENEIARKLHINKLIPVHMSLLDEVTDPDLMSEYDYLDVKRYKPPYDPTNNINLTYNSEFQVNSHRDIKLHDKKPRNDPKETEKRRIKHNMYKMEFYEANGDYRKYPNLDALKQRRVISLLDEPVEDDSVMQDFLMTTHLPVANKTIDRAFEIFIEAQKSITTEVTKFKMMDEYNRTYIHDVKLNKTYYPQIRRHMISFNENETDTHTYEKYTIERQNYYNLSLDIMFTHYVFSTMKHDNITCTYGRMSNVINRWYNKTYYPYYRPSVFRKKYNIAIDRNYVQLLRNLENINEFYQNKIKIMNIDIENITSKVEREKVTVRVHKEMTTVKEKTTEVVREEESTVKEHVIETTTDKFIAQEREKVTVEIDTESGVKEERIKDIDGEVDDFLSAEEMMKLLIKRKEIRRKEYDELMKRSTTTIRPTSVATTKPIHAVTHKMSIKTTTKKPTTTTDLPTITTTTTVLPTSKKLTTETTSTTEKIPTTKKISTTITPARTTLNYPDFELTVEPTEPIEEPKSFLKTLLSRIKPLKIIKSWFSWGKKKPEKSE